MDGNVALCDKGTMTLALSWHLTCSMKAARTKTLLLEKISRIWPQDSEDFDCLVLLLKMEKHRQRQSLLTRCISAFLSTLLLVLWSSWIWIHIQSLIGCLQSPQTSLKAKNIVRAEKCLCSSKHCSITACIAGASLESIPTGNLLQGWLT